MTRPFFPSPPGGPAPSLSWYAGADRAAVAAAVEAGREGGAGPARLVIVARTPAEAEERRARALRTLAGDRPVGPVVATGIYFRARPVGGEVAFVFSAAAGAYPAMGHELLAADPDLLAPLRARFGALDATIRWIDAPPPGGPGLMDKLWGAFALSCAHATFSRERLGLAPTAAIGLSAGEINALVALGAWPDIEGLHAALRGSEVFSRHLGGACEVLHARWGPGARWANWRVVVPEAQLHAALATEPGVRLAITHAPGDYMIGGEASACARLARRLGPRAVHLGYDVALHVPEAAPFAAAWRAIHTRETRPVPGIRFYAHAHEAAYDLGREAVADALTAQATRALDFPRVIERAYADGVRVFVEHGPQSACTAWIRRILGAREHVAVALDHLATPALEQAANAAAQLIAAGVLPAPPVAAAAPAGLGAYRAAVAAQVAGHRAWLRSWPRHPFEEMIAP